MWYLFIGSKCPDFLGRHFNNYILLNRIRNVRTERADMGLIVPLFSESNLRKFCFRQHGQSSPVGLVVRSFMAKFLSQGCQDQAVDELPDIRYESNRLKVPGFVVIAEVIGLNPFVQNNDRLRKNVLPKPSHISRKSPLMYPEDHKANVAKDKLLGLGLATALSLSN